MHIAVRCERLYVRKVIPHPSIQTWAQFLHDFGAGLGSGFVRLYNDYVHNHPSPNHVLYLFLVQWFPNRCVCGTVCMWYRMFTFKVMTEEWLSWVRGGFEGMRIRVRLSEKLGMRSIILSTLELELKSESSNTMNRTCGSAGLNRHIS